MRRILLATTAIVALSAAASPAFAFNSASFVQFGFPGGNTSGTPNEQFDSAPTNNNGNQIRSLGFLPSGSAGSYNHNEFHQFSATNSFNTAYTGQAGDHNNAYLLQTTQAGASGSVTCTKNILGALKNCSVGAGGLVNDSSTIQLGDYNSVSTVQNSTASNGIKKGSNKSTVNQTGDYNGATISQKGGSTQSTDQTGFFQLANTTQDGNGNNSTTKQHGPLLGAGGLQLSIVNQKGDNNSQTTDQNGFLQASITSQNGNGNKSDTSQSGVLNGSATFQNNGATSTTTQTGALNGSLVIQDGANTQTTTQTGSDGQLAITAQGGGSGNTSTTTQNGGVNVSGVGQLGSGNTANVTQSGGNNWSAVGQIGTGNSYALVQGTMP
jgi:hypothetical protein